MPALTVHNAEVKTAAVEVKTLTISGKQVTLAVFRQLQETPLIAQDGSLNGVPWGTVNYHPDKCGTNGDHFHVVWQLGDSLRRSRVEMPKWWRAYFYHDACDAYIQQSCCVNRHRLPEWARREQDSDWDGLGLHPYVIRFQIDDIRCETSTDDFDRPGMPNHTCATRESWANARAELAGLAAAERARRARVDEQWAAICDLPQLFIAV